MLGTFLGAGDVTVNKTDNFCPHGASVLMRELDSKQNIEFVLCYVLRRKQSRTEDVECVCV